MTAEPYDCHNCRRRIGARRKHLIIRERHVICTGCMNDPKLHATYHPDCPIPWHDMYDHGIHLATRAGARWTLTKQENAR